MTVREDLKSGNRVDSLPMYDINVQDSAFYINLKHYKRVKSGSQHSKPKPAPVPKFKGIKLVSLDKDTAKEVEEY